MLVTVLRMVIVALPQVSVALGASKDQVLAHSTVLFFLKVTAGGVIYSLSLLCALPVVLPQASVARQVRVASKVFPQWPVMLVTVPRMVIVALPQVSQSLGASKDQVLVHSTDLLATQLMVGGV